ncbi:glycosyltransferase family 87 protein [Microbacterium neimengense]
MSRRALLWIAFLVVHIGVSVLGWVMPNEPMGDVYRVYEPWSGAYLNSGWWPQTDTATGQEVSAYYGFVGLTDAWVYPQLAMLPMLATWLFAWAVSYTPAWAIMVGLVDAAAFAVLVGRGRSRGRVTAAWFWLAFIALMGPVALYRLDAVTVPLAIMGGLWLIGRPWLGSILLAVATWIKVWPAAIMAAALIAVRRRIAVLGGAAVVSAITLGAVALLGGASYAFGFVGEQTTRGLQVEAPVSTYYLWDGLLGGTSAVHYDPDLLTFYVSGPGVNPVIAVMTPLLGIGVLAIAALGAWKVWRGAHFAAVFPALSLALVAAFISLNKVGSPQYMVWLSVPLVIALVLDRRRWWAPALLALVIGVATQIIYPLVYFDLLELLPFPVVVITIRNILLVVIAAWAVVKLARVRTRSSFARKPGVLAG